MALERLPYFRFHCADYLLDTLALSMSQHGAYCLLIVNYYWNGALPQSREELHALCRADSPEKKADVDFVLDRFFHEKNGAFEHNRIEREREKLGDMVRLNSRAGKASAAARARKTPSAPRGNGAMITLPDWVIVAKWDAWVKIRPAKARTPEALAAAIEKLEKFRAAGHDGNEIIANSLANGWQGLFAPDAKRGMGKQAALEANNIAAARRFLERSENEPER